MLAWVKCLFRILQPSLEILGVQVHAKQSIDMRYGDDQASRFAALLYHLASSRMIIVLAGTSILSSQSHSKLVRMSRSTISPASWRQANNPVMEQMMPTLVRCPSSI